MYNLNWIKMIGAKLIALLLVAKCAESANILVMLPFSAVSHYNFVSSIGIELARRGHNVTVVTKHLEKNPLPSYHQIKVLDNNVWQMIAGGEDLNIFDMAALSPEAFHTKVHWPGGVALTDLTLRSPDVKEFLKKDNQFDLVICEQFYQEALYALSVKYNAPLAIISTFGNCMRHNMITRNPLQLATILSEYLNVKSPGSFLGRFRNLYFSVYDYFWWRYWYLEKQEELVKKYLPELVGKAPSLYDLQKDTSLYLINSHFSYDTPLALLPNIVEIGGAHLTQSNASLPEALQKLLDESKNGVVYVSFGSNVQSKHLTEAKKNAIINVFKRLKQTVLWKWEDDELDGKPKNVITRKWFPQKEILRHPNIKVFIAHGGLLGIQEAIFNGIPIVGIPVYGDQYNNLLLIQEKGAGRLLQYEDITEETFGEIINDVLSNESYLEKAKELERIWKDRPMSPMDTAMYWLEYIIRNKGAEYMKNPARNMNWFAYTMMDVYAFIVVIFIVAVAILIKLIKAVTSFQSAPKPKATKSKKRS